jgi:hypothetical protein
MKKTEFVEKMIAISDALQENPKSEALMAKASQLIRDYAGENSFSTLLDHKLKNDSNQALFAKEMAEIISQASDYYSS